MKTSRNERMISRRSAIVGAGAGAGGLAIASAGITNRVSAQSGSLAEHPMAGTWLVLANPALAETPQTPNVTILAADGTFYAMFPPSDIGRAGPMLQSDLTGIWEPYDDRRAHFLAFQIQSDANGNVLGMVSIDGYPMASEDGQSFEDDGEMVQVTIRDANGVVLDSFPGAGGRPVRGKRLTFESSSFPDPLDSSATPNS
jgi:hypothetical protein